MSNNDNWEAQLSAIEKNAYLELFKKVDTDSKGIVLQDEAFPFFKTSNIPENILTEFWSATDSEKKGFLTDKEFCIMLKLIACAQNGVMINDPVLTTQAPLPVFGSNHMSSPRQAPQLQQTQQSPSNIDIVPPENRTKYIGLFQSFGPVNNILNGERAKAAFMRSGLPPAVLQNIWNLADTRKSGTLNQTEFIIAMHYIENVMKGAGNLPSTLPASVYASATGRAVAPSPLVRNNTLQVSSPPTIPSRSPVMQRRGGAPLDIPSDDYQKYSTFFQQLDTDNSGFVTGADAVVFFKHSGLPEADLARIWDLADTNSSGQLNEKEFAIAMHLINRKNAGGDIPNAVSNVNIVSSVNQPAYQQQQQQQNTEDLLGLFSDFSAPAPTTPQAPIQQQPTSTSFSAPQQTSIFTVDPSHPQPIQQQHTSTSFNTNLFTPQQAPNFAAESNHLQTVQNQLHTESQAVQGLQKQVDEQKEALAKIKQQADEAERQLEAERKKKEDLTKELQMYKQEIKHYATRIESANEETEKLKKENDELEKEKQKQKQQQQQQQQQPAPVASPVPPHNDFFSLSSSRSGGQLFAKVEDATSPVLSQHTGSTVQSHNKFDPFAGFKATQAAPSPTVSLNKLKEESKRSSPNVDISDIESKFPDLNTMEEQFKTPSSPAPAAASPVPVSPSISTSSKKEAPKPDIYASLFSKPSPAVTTTPVKKDPNSKYGFDLSAFESPSTTTASPFETKSSVKDELSSLFGSPSTSTTNQPKASSDFDNIFGSGK